MMCQCECPDSPPIEQRKYEARHFKGDHPSMAEWDLGRVLDGPNGETAIAIQLDDGQHGWLIKGGDRWVEWVWQGGDN